MNQSTTINIKLKEVFELFIVEKETSSVGEKGIKNYISTFKKFNRDLNLNDETLINEIDKTHISNWVKMMKESNIRSASINHYLTEIRVFLYWCMNEEYLPYFKIKNIKCNEEVIKFYNDDEVEKLIQKPNKNCTFAEYRTYVIVCFCLSTGARASTITNLKIEDIDFNRKEILYRHLKNRSVSIVPLSPSLEKILLEYLNVWKQQKPNWLFPEIGETQLTVSGLSQSLKRYCIKRGVKCRGIHSLRHTFARMFIKNGGNSFVLQKMLTHSNISTTQRYVKLFGSDLHNDINAYSPLDNLKIKSSRKQTIRRSLNG